VLWLVGDNEAQMQNLRRWAAARGVAPQRLVFAGRLPYAEHLARYALTGLVLDTLPFNGGTTTSDALWGGAPVLTCSGNTFAGRMAASLLRAVGLDELVTHNLDDYQATALHLAHNPGETAALRGKLAANRETCPLFDTARCTRHIEAAYVEMWRRFDAGLPPAHMDIPHA
jgi:predicted O-linked N-acetylglucosamine transferase (SPINDLY family)